MSLEFSDRDVEQKGIQLEGVRIDFIVAGGIAAIESPKWIRELRRYGAEVRVVMTEAATRFVSDVVFEWASKNAVVTDLTGSAEHITDADAVVVAPATLDFISKIANGIGDSAASILVQSALGRIPIFLAPSMHLSLAGSPAYQRNLTSLHSWPHIHFLLGREEESKSKALDFETAVAQITHAFRSSRLAQARSAVISLGPTRSYADEVRYVSNLSTGALGKEIALALYRSGISMRCVAGPIQTELPEFLHPVFVETREQMEQQFQRIVNESQPDIAIFSAAVLDFEIRTPKDGKVSSKNETWDLSLSAAPKLMNRIHSTHSMLRVGFKLESRLSVEMLKSRVVEWVSQTPCEFIVANRREDLPPFCPEHVAYIYSVKTQTFTEARGKVEIAERLVDLLLKTSLQN